jgi:ribosome biogenesis protein Nip4
MDICDSIKNDINDKIEIMKKGNLKEQYYSTVIQDYVSNIECFYCLDSKQLWGFRSTYYVWFGASSDKYYIMSCDKCSTGKWLRDTPTNTLYSSAGYAIFNKEDQDSDIRFVEIRKVVEENHPYQEPPIYKNIDSDRQHIHKEFVNFDMETEGVVKLISVVIKMHMGVAAPDLVEQIKLHVSIHAGKSKKEKTFYKSLDDKKFFFIVISNKSYIKKSGFNIFSYGKKVFDVEYNYTFFEADNESAVKECQMLIQKAGKKEIAVMNNAISRIYRTSRNSISSPSTPF